MAPGHPQAPVREGGPGFVPELRGSTFSGLSRAWGREQRWPWPGLRGGGPLCVQCNYQEMGGVAPGTVESHGDPLKASSEFSDSENVPGRVSPSHLPLVSFCEGGSD